MHITEEDLLDDGVLERVFTVDDVPGVLWTPPSGPASLVLIGHPGGQHKRLPRVVARARYYAARYGFAVAAIDAPGCGDRPRRTADDQARSDLRRAIRAGEPIDDILAAFVVPLVDQAVPEWQATLDALQSLPGIGGRVGYEGMNAIGIGLAAVEPRVAATVLFGSTSVPTVLRERARQVTVPTLFLLQWDDENNDRQAALDLFDALGSPQKTLHANLGGHIGTPAFELDDAARFFARHLA